MSWDEPKTLEEAITLAKTLANSTLLPKELQSPQNVLLVMGYAKSLRVSPFVALRIVQIIKGKPTLSADGMAAVVRGSSLVARLDVIESTDERCVVVAQRVGGTEVEVVWDLARAKRAGLGGNQWDGYKRQMLRARAVSEVCRMVWPDVVGGVYDPDELRQVVDAEPYSPPAIRQEVLAIQADPEPDPHEETVAEVAASCVAELEARGLDDALTRLRVETRAQANGGEITAREVMLAYGALLAEIDTQKGAKP